MVWNERDKMCFKTAARRLRENGIDIGNSALSALPEVIDEREFDITFDGNHPCDYN